MEGRETQRLPVVALLGSMVGMAALIGVADAILLLTRPGSPPLSWRSIGLTAFHLGVIDGLVGLLLALTSSLPLLLLSRNPLLVRRLPDLCFGLLGLGAVAAAGHIVIRPPTWAAVDVRLEILFGLVVLVAVVMRFSLVRPERVRILPDWTRLVVLSLLLATGASLILLQQRIDPDVQEALIESSITGPCLSRILRRASDQDRDGFPTLLCGRDCDCNDQDPEVNPAAVDQPGDGVDSDCSGSDGHAPSSLPEVAGSSPGVAGARAGSSDPALAELPVPDSRQEPSVEPSAPVLPGQAPTNFLLITVDTLRADHVSAYGYARNTTPRLDALAQQGTLFEQARAQGPMTRFSIPSFVTGRYHTELKRTGGKWPRFSVENRPMGQRFSELGYKTALVSCHFYFKRRYGMSVGFNTVNLRPAYTRTPFHRHITGDLVTDHAIELLPMLAKARPFLLWLHYGDPHSDYQRHPDGPQWGRRRKDLYDGEIYYSDQQIARFLEAFRKQGLMQDTVLIITSDHGEGLVRSEDHGKLFHGQHLYDNLVRVPLIILGPSVLAQRLTTPAVGLIDLLPTMLELARAPPDPSLRGTSLVPYLQGCSLPRPPVFGERPRGKDTPKKYMVQWPYKLIWDMGLNRFRLFDLSMDPNERKDLFYRRSGLAKEMVATLKSWRTNELAETRVLARLP